MASAIEPKDPPPPLSLALDTMPSSSPFPSPGSSFLPPPMPGPHEFAVRPPSAGTGSARFSRKSSRNLKKDTDELAPSANGAATTGISTTSTSNIHNINNNSYASNGHSGSGVASQPSTLSPTVVTDPTTPTPGGAFSAFLASPSLTPTQQHSSSPSQSLLHPDLQSSLQPQPDLSPQQSDTMQTSQQLSTSLTSTRPAPPSPAVSRRASTAPSTHSRTSSRSRPVSGIASSRPPSGVVSRPVSGTMSRPVSGIGSRPSSARRSKDAISLGLGMFTVDEREKENHAPGFTASSGSAISGSKDDANNQESHKDVGQKTNEDDAISPMSTLIKIRDFAFPAADARFAGLGDEVPRPNRPTVLDKRLRGFPSSESSDEEEDEWEIEEDEEEGGGEGGAGWGGFGWAGFGRLSWGAGERGPGTGEKQMPSDTDFARNFGIGDDNEESEEWEDGEEGEYIDCEEGGTAEDGEPPLLPGLYRALYAFEPEGTAEMKLEEDQIVRVVGRGGGVGWAVVVKDLQSDSGTHALVPESYLEAVKLDCEDDEAIVEDQCE